MFSCEFRKIFNSTFSYRIPLMAASVTSKKKDMVYKEATISACFFLNDINDFLRSFLKKTEVLVQIHLTANKGYYGIVLF